MSTPGQQFGRLKNDKKLKIYMNDEENSMMYTPENYTGNKFFGRWSTMMTLQNMLFYEKREKYFYRH